MVQAGESEGPYTNRKADEITEWPGTRLSSDDFKQGNVLTFEKHPRVRYGWAAGEAISRFLHGLKEGQLLGRRCDECERVLFPPRMFCEECFRDTDDWVELPDTGTVETYSISYLDTDANRIEEPILVGVVSIDGAAEHHGMMHYFGGMDKDDIEIGMKVKAKWKPADEREGSVRDILHWAPLDGEGDGGDGGTTADEGGD